MTERVAIVGARDCSPETEALVRTYVRLLPRGTQVISGGASGVDSVAVEEAHRCIGLETLEFRPRRTIGRCFVIESRWCGDEGGIWEDGGWTTTFAAPSNARDALLFRNTVIATHCDRMVAFVAGSKGGTWDAVKQAERFKRPCEVIR
jgi:predicted Rossmann fold nucleotide-binding protein DprA/Smf involved in DNA uptake